MADRDYLAEISNIQTGTLAVVSNLTNGSVNILTGTVSLNPKPSITLSSFATVTTAANGTLVAAPGVGTSIYVSAVSISVITGTQESLVSFGTAQTGGQVLERGLFSTGGGLLGAYSFPVTGGVTDTPLTWNTISGNGSIAISVKYWTGV